MSENKTVNKQTLLWVGVAVVSALVAIVTVAVILRRYFGKKEQDKTVECISYDFSPEEVAFDDEFGADTPVFTEQAEE